MKKKTNFIVSMCVLMLALCGILFIIESRAEGSSIKSIGDALWYMIVTLTTVGYGDVYPVTIWGKIIGILFILSSMGLLAFILAAMIKFFNSDVIPALYLKKHRDDVWYIFSELNENTRTLIRDIKGEEKKIFICLGKGEENLEEDILNIDSSFEKIIGLKADKSKLHLFFMKNCKNDYENYAEYYNACSSCIDDNVLPFHCYCLTEYVPDVIPVNLVCFNKYENISRLYWNAYPLRTDLGYDEKIVLIGMGRFGGYILEHALERNVVKVNQNVEYHIFGKWQDFRQEHYRLDEFFSIDKRNNERDAIFFHEQSWMEVRDVIENASRIIICDDEEEHNLRTLSKMRKYFKLKNPEVQIHVLFSQKINDTGIETFGTLEDIYSEEFVLKEKLRQMAFNMNAIYRKDNSSALDWNHLSEFKRQSNLAAADHIDVKLKLLNAANAKEAYNKYTMLSDSEKMKLWNLEHDRWMRFHIVYNWHYSGTRNDAFREHNLIVPFDSLPYEEQKKDEYSWELLSKM